MTVNIKESDEWLAEIYSKQAAEWMRNCKSSQQCPAARVFKYLMAQQAKIERLEHYIKIIEDRKE